MSNETWNLTDTISFLAWGSVARDAREQWRQAQYEKHGIDPEDKDTKQRWTDGKFNDTERAILEETDNLYWKALNDLPGIIYSRGWTVIGRKKGKATREPIPLIFWQSAAIDFLGEDGGEAHPTIEIEGHKRAAIFKAGYDRETRAGLRFIPDEVRNAVSNAPHNLTQKDREVGGRRSRFNAALQEAIDRIRDELDLEKKKMTLGTVKDWLNDKASYQEPYQFDEIIPDCDDLYISGGRLVWKDRDDREQDMALKSLERYIARANQRS